MTRPVSDVVADLREFTAWYKDNPEPGIPTVVPPLIKQAAAPAAPVAATVDDRRQG